MAKYKNEHNDDYLLQVNLLGATTYEELKEAEAFAFTVRAVDLESKEKRLTSFREMDFKKLHHYLFQDIYPFAGKYRNVQLTKDNTHFCRAEYISTYAGQLFSELHKDPPWTSKDQAAQRLAYFKSELNILHPFREGNGRTIRMFIHAYALTQGFRWDYDKMDREVYIKAMIKSVTDTTALCRLIFDTLVQNN